MGFKARRRMSEVPNEELIEALNKAILVLERYGDSCNWTNESYQDAMGDWSCSMYSTLYIPSIRRTDGYFEASQVLQEIKDILRSED